MNSAETLALDVMASVGNGAVEVSYALQNRTGRTVVAFDGATGIGGGPFPDLTGQCYVSYADGAARIIRVRPGPHPTKDTTRIFMPAGSVMEPGQTRNVQFRLPLPLKERAEYSPDYPGAKYAERAAHRLELRIGYFFMTPDTVVKPKETPGVVQVVRAASLSETFLVTNGCAAAFDMLVRTDDGFLRM